MNVSDNLPLPATNDASYSGAVRIAAALKPVAMATSPTATVASKFLSFADGDDEGTDPDQLATVGSFTVGMADPALINAADGTDVVMENLIDIGENTVNDVADDGSDSSVTVTGDFSFASRVTFDEMAGCDAAATSEDMRMDPEGEGEDMTRDTTKLKAQTVAYVNARSNLCIMVLAADDDDAVAIPETAPYMAMTTYAAGTPEAKFAPPMGTHALGMIERDGTHRTPALPDHE